MTNSALTRWLKQGLSRSMCPLCRVVHKADAEYICYFIDEYSDDQDVLDELRRAHGFCADHAEQLRRVEVDGLRSTLGLATTYHDTLQGVAAALESLAVGGRLQPGPCPACRYRDREVSQNAAHLLQLLHDDSASRDRFADSPGLCLPHFRLV